MVVAMCMRNSPWRRTRERIRQIENKAIRKLRHPSRAKKIRDFYC